MIIGNSSSGLIEAPVVGTKVINVGERQKGRIRPKEVININCEKKIIEKSIDRALKMKIKNLKIFIQILIQAKNLQIY